MDKRFRELYRLVEREGLSIDEVDKLRGKGRHIMILASYKGRQLKLHVSPDKFKTDRHVANFVADLRRKKRVIDGEAA